MANAGQHKIWALRVSLQAVATWLVLATVFLLTVVMAQAALAQTFQVLHNFTGGPDGSYPQNGLTIDRAGLHLYGTALNGGAGFGTIYELTQRNGSWTFATLYRFAGGSDGAGPDGRVTIGPNGTLYGSTVGGGEGACSEFGYSGCGTIFNLTPRPSICSAISCPWIKSVLHTFTGGSDGGTPWDDLTFDQSGNLYGITGASVSGCYGVAYELSPSQGSWNDTVLYCFSGAAGVGSHGGVTFDNAGNIYGVLTLGGQGGGGAAYELTASGSGWNEDILTDFPNPQMDGYNPVGGLIIDSGGNLFGTAFHGGPANGGTVFELSPSGGGWTYTVLYGLGGSSGSMGKLAMDAAGNLYGTTDGDGMYGQGSVFELTPSNGSWIYTDLHDFTGGSDGGDPRYGGVVLDSSGNLYGTAANGGTGAGVVWKITP